MVRPKKHLGQHFLTDPSVASRIVDSLQAEDGANILEIGPGKGILTRWLLEIKNIRLKAVELDAESVEHLHHLFPSLQVIQQDFLKINLNEVFEGSSFKIIGNFPYNISSQIVFSILEHRTVVSEMVGMFQKEVARRICCGPGSKEYGILSVLCQANYKTEYLFTVNEGVFFPPPKVKSGVIRFTRKDEVLNETDFKKLSILVKLAFNQRRKQLRNSIKSMLPDNFNNEILTKRPEDLHYTEFIELMHQL